MCTLKLSRKRMNNFVISGPKIELTWILRVVISFQKRQFIISMSLMMLFRHRRILEPYMKINTVKPARYKTRVDLQS